MISFTTIKNNLQKIFLPEWGRNYSSGFIHGDVLAGIIVAIMLIPQSMAYAMLAGLPPQIGLYASILPLFLYARFGSSRTLAVGPVAIVSLMVASSLAPFAEIRSAEYVQLALLLAFMSGVILLLAGLFRLGVLTNFIGHPVIAGFTSAAALIIGFSQLKHLLGVNLDRTHLIPKLLFQVWEKLAEINPVTLAIAVISIIALLSKKPLTGLLKKRNFSEMLVDVAPKGIALVLVIISTWLVWLLSLDKTAGIKIVEHIPQQLPPLSMPDVWSEHFRDLLLPAVLISVVGFVESLSVAKSLAAKRRQKVSANQELMGLGTANLASSFTGGYAVTGGFSRSVVNFTSGANTQLASIITAVLIAIVLLLFAPMLYFLPKAVLGAIIVVAVANLVDFKPFFHAWKYNRADGLSYLVTFLAVLGLGVEEGILLGVLLSLGLYLWRTSQPHIAIVGRVGDSEHFRNIERHKVKTYDNLLLVRIDENLYFANTSYLEEYLLAKVCEHEEVEHLVLIMSSVGYIDSSALESLELMVDNLKAAGVTVHLAEVNGPVMDGLKNTHLQKHMAPGQVFLSTHKAVKALQPSK